MSPRTAKEIARWAGIVVTGGFALTLSYGLLKSLFDVWFRGQGEPFFGTCIILSLFALPTIPAALLGRALYKRDYFEVINVAAAVAAVVAFFSFFSLVKNTGLQRWLLDPGEAGASEAPWRMALASLHMVLLLLLLAAPFMIARTICRFGNRWARRHLLPPAPVSALQMNIDLTPKG